MSKIELKHIDKFYGKNHVLKDLNLTIEDGDFMTLLGPSGCGKTTTLRVVSGLEKPQNGFIYMDGKEIVNAAEAYYAPPSQRNLNLVFQSYALWPHMTVFENVAFGLRARKDTKDLEERVMEALRAVRLEEYAKRYPHQLSGGQQQRVAFARSIVIRSSCILFDEPLSALDALLREEMRHELKELVSRLGVTAVFVTHDQTEAMSISDRIAVLNVGVVDQYDSPEQIYHHPATAFVAHFVGKSNWLSDTEFFRPEAIGLEAREGWRHYELPVQDIQYLGDTYEITLPYEGKTWMLHGNHKAVPGETLSVYIDPEQIISCGKEN